MAKPGGPHIHDQDEVVDLPERLTAHEAELGGHASHIETLHARTHDHADRLTALEGDPPPPPPPPEIILHLAWSQFRDRIMPDRLDGDHLAGEVAIFVEGDESNIAAVEFSINGHWVRTEGFAPYDLGGTAADGLANLYNVDALSPGIHQVEARVAWVQPQTLPDGSTETSRTLTGAFQVDEVAPPPPPPPDGHDEVVAGLDPQAAYTPGRELWYLAGVHGGTSLQVAPGANQDRLVLKAGAELNGLVPDAAARRVWDAPAAGRRFPFRGLRDAIGITIEGEGDAFTSDAHAVIRDWQCYQQQGALGGDGFGANATVANIELVGNGYAGLRGGPGIDAQHLHIHGNAQQGMAGVFGGSAQRRGRYADNHEHHNNTLGIDALIETAAKFVRSANFDFIDNEVHDQVGVGIWGDIANGPGVVIARNHVYDCTGVGISWELNLPSGDPIPDGLDFYVEIFDNIVERCGQRDSNWLWGAQILLQNASRCWVHGNTVVTGPGSPDGIAIINQYRTLYGEQVIVSTQNLVEDNDVKYGGVAGQTGIVDDRQAHRGGKVAYTDGTLNASGLSGQNLFLRNRYYGSAAKLASRAWTDNGQNLLWAEWQAAGQDVGGSLHVV